jgi:hypothetical protein
MTVKENLSLFGGQALGALKAKRSLGLGASAFGVAFSLASGSAEG